MQSYLSFVVAPVKTKHSQTAPFAARTEKATFDGLEILEAKKTVCKLEVLIAGFWKGKTEYLVCGCWSSGCIAPSSVKDKKSQQTFPKKSLRLVTLKKTPLFASHIFPLDIYNIIAHIFIQEKTFSHRFNWWCGSLMLLFTGNDHTRTEQWMCKLTPYTYNCNTPQVVGKPECGVPFFLSTRILISTLCCYYYHHRRTWSKM